MPRLEKVPLTDQEIEKIFAQRIQSPYENVILNDENLEKQKKQQEIQQSQSRFDSEMDQRKIDLSLKKHIALFIFTFLSVETLLVFTILFLQGFHLYNFSISDTTLNIFLGATIIQISTMAIMVIRHLFPNHTEKETTA